MKVVVTVLSKQGHILYPSNYNEDSPSLLGENRSDLNLAEDNFRILNEGLYIQVSVTLDPNSLPSYIILTILAGLSIGILYTMYLRSAAKARFDHEANENKWAAMLEREEEYRNKLESLSDERKEMESRLNEMKNKLAEVRLSEDGLIEEIVHLEKMIDENSKLQKAQNNEIETLKSLIEKSEGEKKARLKKRIKGHDATEKRFKTLYKNLAFHERALEGYRDLEEDVKLKCEEIVHLLNSDPDKVIIKRKVFGKKNRETVFEVIFSYNGRLYFRKLKEGAIEVLAVGTKNSQERELEFLDKL
jgi:predicted RNase H-like nuclease (RuvC/YqgF family)